MKLLLEERTSRFEIFKKWFLRAVVALLFIAIGSNKFAAHSPWVKIFEMIGFGQWFRYFTGVMQVTGALLVLIPRTFAVGILMLACTMFGAAAAWIFLLGEPMNAMFPAAILGGLLIAGGEDLIEFGTACHRRWSGPRIRHALAPRTKQ